VRQSARGDAYSEALERLRAHDLVYPCSCSRGEIPPGPAGQEPRYPGTCRAGPRRADARLALRFRTDAVPGRVTVDDRAQGRRSQDVDATVGDFVLRRRDGFWAYQLAVVVDDAAQGITDVVRGLDLWDNTPRQLLLQRALGVPGMRYLHLPLVTSDDGEKLAKSRRALPVGTADTSAVLSATLRALAVPVPTDLDGARPAEQLAWAVGRWDPGRLVGRPAVADTAFPTAANHPEPG
jgi:glutamyl-Q tRNA(Asp) synthetase